MSNVEDIKKKWAEKLKEAAAGITNKDKYQVCINLDINSATFDRYTGGNHLEVRRLELAEKILPEIEQVRAASLKA